MSLLIHKGIVLGAARVPRRRRLSQSGFLLEQHGVASCCNAAIGRRGPAARVPPGGASRLFTDLSTGISPPFPAAIRALKIARVALDVPLDETFDFRVPDGLDPPPGALVVVPFGRSRKVGMVVERVSASEVPAERLKDLERQVEDVPPIAAADLELLRFCAS